MNNSKEAKEKKSSIEGFKKFVNEFLFLFLLLFASRTLTISLLIEFPDRKIYIFGKIPQLS